MDVFDTIIIGAGQAGNPLSQALAKSGEQVALIEEQFVGGTCINVGCTPTKTMVASAEVVYLANRALDFGVVVEDVAVDMKKVKARKAEIVKSIREGSRNRIINSGVELIFGAASFTGHKTLKVVTEEGETREVTAEKVIIDAGGRPRIPDIEGLANVPYLNSTSIMELESVPEHLIIVGGGYIAIEFGQMFRRFGSEVTVIQHSDQLLTREDRDIADEIRAILEEDGIKVFLNTDTTAVEKNNQTGVTLYANSPEGEITLHGSHLLVAVGRVPNSDRLNLEKTSVETDTRGYIKVNGRLETNVPGIYAVGDIKGGPAFTHIAYDDFRILKANLLEGGDLSIEGRPVPYVLFSDPQLGRIGLSEKDARRQEIECQVAKIPMNYIARTLEIDRPRGLIKALVDPDSEQILGAAVLGYDGGEIMAMLEIAMIGEVTYKKLRDGIFAHPTLAEGLNTLFANLS
jgi:pyruvate/2-oxoglutarate dehydrogenase complex dihydrolipoamide dehydrogenase (E3) component